MCYSIYEGYVTSRMFLGNNKEAEIMRRRWIFSREIVTSLQLLAGVRGQLGYHDCSISTSYDKQSNKCNNFNKK